MRALIAARDLVSPTCLWENADLYMLDISPSDGNGNDVLRLACGGTSMTPNAASVIDYLGPLNWVGCFHDAGRSGTVRLYHYLHITQITQVAAGALHKKSGIPPTKSMVNT